MQEARPTDAPCGSICTGSIQDAYLQREVYPVSDLNGHHAKNTSRITKCKFAHTRLLKTPEHDAEFWKPCKQDDDAIGLYFQGMMIVAECVKIQLLGALDATHGRIFGTLYAVGPGRACASL